MFLPSPPSFLFLFPIEAPFQCTVRKTGKSLRRKNYKAHANVIYTDRENLKIDPTYRVVNNEIASLDDERQKRDTQRTRPTLALGYPSLRFHRASETFFLLCFSHESECYIHHSFGFTCESDARESVYVYT